MIASRLKLAQLTRGKKRKKRKKTSISQIFTKSAEPIFQSAVPILRHKALVGTPGGLVKYDLGRDVPLRLEK